MTISMTGFGRAYAENEEIQVKIEMKSVNNRYNDFSIKLPRIYAFTEDKLKKILKKQISRGKVDVYITVYNKSNSNSKIDIDMKLAKKYYDAITKIKNKLKIRAKIKISDITTISGIINVVEGEINEDESYQIINSTFNKALEGLLNMKKTEGENIKVDMLLKVEQLKEYLSIVEKQAPVIVEEYREKLKIKLNELIEDKNFDENRLNQEVAYLADRASIDEEITRLASHIDQFNSNLVLDNTGRKLDFIIQEMNREINTIGSKANSLVITNSVLECKSIIEKLREQAMNIE